jgi:hypothetical protein
MLSFLQIRPFNLGISPYGRQVLDVHNFRI